MKYTLKKRNKHLQVNETFVEKDPSDEVDLLVDRPNFDGDEVNTNNSNDEDRRNTTNDFDSIVYENLIGEFLLELREIFKISTAVTCFVSEKLSAIINVDPKQHIEMFHKSYSKNFCDPLFSESPFTSPCEKCSKEKELSNYIKQKFHRAS